MFIQLYEEKYMRFPDGKAKALTLSYDDGVQADIRLLKIFKKHGLKGAFNLNSKLFDCAEWHGRMDEEQTLKTFCDCGQEIALHGARHIFLDKAPLAEGVKEVADNRAYLEDKFGTIVRGMAYAYGAFNADIKRVLKDLGVAYARTTVSSHSFAVPDDWLELNPTCHHTEAEFARLADEFFSSSPQDAPKHREPWLFYVWGHSFEFDDYDNWNVIEDFAARAEKHADSVWFATNIQIYEYVKAYEALVFSFDGERVYNPSAIPVWLELRGKIYRLDGGKETVFGK